MMWYPSSGDVVNEDEDLPVAFSRSIQATLQLIMTIIQAKDPAQRQRALSIDIIRDPDRD